MICFTLSLHLRRERLLSSVSLYAIARHAYQEADYDEAIIALEESLALRLFAYADQKTLDRWQQGLVMPGSLFRRQKMDLANTLVLRSDCLVQLARVSSGWQGCQYASSKAAAAGGGVAVHVWQGGWDSMHVVSAVVLNSACLCLCALVICICHPACL